MQYCTDTSLNLRASLNFLCLGCAAFILLFGFCPGRARRRFRPVFLSKLVYDCMTRRKRDVRWHSKGTWIVRKSTRNNKKWVASHDATETQVHFGHPDYDDYTTHKDLARRENYISRHRTGEDWNDLSSAAAWSRYLLWEKKTMTEAAESMEDRFKIRIKLLRGAPKRPRIETMNLDVDEPEGKKEKDGEN